MLKTELLGQRFPSDEFLDVINTDVNNGFGLFRIPFEDSIDISLSIAQTNLGKLEESEVGLTYDLMSMETDDGSQLVTFRGGYNDQDQDDNDTNVITRLLFLELNGHNITSGVLIPYDSNNALFSEGTYVLFANKWFIEVSDNFDEWLPFVIKDLTQLICSEDKPTDSTVANQTTGMTDNEDTEQSSHTGHTADIGQSTKTERSTNSRNSKDSAHSTDATKVTKRSGEPEETPSSKMLSTVLLIVGIISVIIILMVALGFVYIISKPKPKRHSKKKSSKKRSKDLDQTEVTQTEVKSIEDRTSQTSDFFEPNSGNDYSKPISAPNTKITDPSMTELGKPTDMTIK